MTKPFRIRAFPKVKREPCCMRMYEGCCCTCKYHHTLYGHPWVTGTSTNQPVGVYICAPPQERDEPAPRITVSQKHGYCEMYERR